MSGGIQVKAEVDIASWQRAWNALGRDQLPFATAATLTSLAKSAQARVRQELPSRFKVRSTWTSRGIQIQPASKRDWPRAYALVGTRDAHMVDQELGAVRKPRSGRNIAIPTKRVKRKGSGAVRAAQRPRRLIQRKKAYATQRAIKLKDTRRTKHQAAVMFLLRPVVKIRARFGFEDTVRDVVRREASQAFQRELGRALRTRRA